MAGGNKKNNNRQYWRLLINDFGQQRLNCAADWSAAEDGQVLPHFQQIVSRMSTHHGCILIPLQVVGWLVGGSTIGVPGHWEVPLQKEDWARISLVSTSRFGGENIQCHLPRPMPNPPKTMCCPPPKNWITPWLYGGNSIPAAQTSPSPILKVRSLPLKTKKKFSQSKNVPIDT